MPLHISTDPSRLGGKAHLEGTDLTVDEIVRMYGCGMTAAEIAEQHGPPLTASDVESAVRYHGRRFTPQSVPTIKDR